MFSKFLILRTEMYLKCAKLITMENNTNHSVVLSMQFFAYRSELAYFWFLPSWLESWFFGTWLEPSSLVFGVWKRVKSWSRNWEQFSWSWSMSGIRTRDHPGFSDRFRNMWVFISNFITGVNKKLVLCIIVSRYRLSMVGNHDAVCVSSEIVVNACIG